MCDSTGQQIDGEGRKQIACECAKCFSALSVVWRAVGKYTNQTQDKQNKAVTVLTAKNLMRNGTKKSGYY